MKIILSGSVAIDQIMSFTGSFQELIQKEHLDKISLSVLVQNLIRSNGGTAGNIAYSLALIGERPILLASVGADAKNYIDHLNKIGVNTNLVHFSQLPTATFNVLTDREENQIGSFYEGAMSDANSLNFSQFTDEKEDILAVISAHNPEAMGKQVQECKSSDIKLLYDPGQQIANLNSEDLMDGLEAASILILNEYEMSLLKSKTKLDKQAIITKTDLCIITLGKNGAKFYEKTNSHKEQSIYGVNLEKPIDPTGAGDAFRAGFIYAYAKKWPIKKAIEFACVIASFAVEKNGTQNHKLNWLQIKKRYQETYAKRLQN